MRSSRKDKHILLHIIDYCNQVKEAVDQIETLECLVSSNFNKNALSMPLVQIGELVGNFTDEFKESFSQVPWVQIKALRNVLVHSYGKIDWNRVWDTAINDIPDLQKKCVEIQKTLESQQSQGNSR